MPDLLNAISTIKWNEFIQGWTILSLNGNPIFQAGIESYHIVSAEICTMNGILTRYEGYCFSDLVLYINEELKKKLIILKLTAMIACILYFRLLQIPI